MFYFTDMGGGTKNSYRIQKSMGSQGKPRSKNTAGNTEYPTPNLPQRCSHKKQPGTAIETFIKT